MEQVKFKIDGEKKVGKKIYFDLSIYISGHKFKINQCFVEKGERGDWLLRLPTKKTRKGIYQINWFDNDIFNEACKFTLKHFEGEVK